MVASFKIDGNLEKLSYVPNNKGNYFLWGSSGDKITICFAPYAVWYLLWFVFARSIHVLYLLQDKLSGFIFVQRCMQYDVPRDFVFDLVRETNNQFTIRTGWVYKSTSPVLLPAAVIIQPPLPWTVLFRQLNLLSWKSVILTNRSPYLGNPWF